MENNDISCIEESTHNKQHLLSDDTDLNNTLLQHFQAAFVIHAADTTIVRWNLKALELLDLSEKQIEGKSAFDPDWYFIHEDGSKLPVADYPVNRVIHSQQAIYNVIIGINRPARNDVVWAQVSAEPVYGPGQNIMLVVVTFMDVSEQVLAQKKLYESESRYRSVIDALHEGLVMQLNTGEIVACNPAAEEILGLTEDQMRGRTSVDPRWRAIHEDGSPFQGEEHPAMVTLRTGISQYKVIMGVKKPNGTLVWISINTSPICTHDAQHPVAVVSTFTDITAIRESEEKLLFLAHHDPLTKLPNRILYYNQVEHALKRAARNSGMFAILFMDLDRFKHINDSVGHAVGDEILLSISDIVKTVLREKDVIARLGGDEFTILIEDIADQESPAMVAQKILDAMRKSIKVKDRVFYISVSIGISVYPGHGNDVITLVSNADTAMYNAKEKGRGNYQFYTGDLTKRAMERVKLVTDLNHSIENGELSVVLQARFDLDSGTLIGAEALARWRHNRIAIEPDRFIPIAEEYGLIDKIGEYVLETSCLFARMIQEKYKSRFRVSINISLRQMHHPNAYAIFTDIIERTGCPPSSLEFELTETLFAEHTEQLLQLLNDLRMYGIALSIDDFGKGYSSLSHLKQFPLHKLKIDASFVRDIPEDENDMAIARAIIALGHSLQLDVVAEGIETSTQRDFLMAEGCDEVQGFYYAKPMPINEFIEQLPNWIRLGRDSV